MSGWVKNHRKIKDWGWYKKPLTAHLFQHLIREANHKAGTVFGVQLERGQLVTGRNSLACETGLTAQEVRTALGHLKKTGEIKVESTKKFSIITILNYEIYQGSGTDDQELEKSPSIHGAENRPTNQPSDQPSNQPSKPAGNVPNSKANNDTEEKEQPSNQPRHQPRHQPSINQVPTTNKNGRREEVKEKRRRDPPTKQYSELIPDFLQ